MALSQVELSLATQIRELDLLHTDVGKSFRNLE